MGKINNIRIAAAAALLLATGCITNDIPYPVVTINIESLAGEGFTCTTQDIDTKNCIATLNLEETTDISKVHITDFALTEGGTSSVALIGVHDLRTPLYTTLHLYQDYPWTIQAKQTITRDFQVEGQIGAAEFNEILHTVTVKVAKSTDLSNLGVSAMKLGPADITTYSPTLEELSGTSFESIRRVDVKYHDFAERWTIYTEPTEQNVFLARADAWAKRIYLYGNGISGEALGFRYRLHGETAWQEVPDITSSGGAFSACLKGLEPATAYDFIAYSGEEVTAVTTVTTDTTAPLPNGDFEEWSTSPNNDKLYYPYTDTASSFWGSGNQGATAVGGPSITIPENDPRPGSSGTRCAKLQSKVVVIKFAAGNLFVGKYLRTVGTNGIVGFGRPFTHRPTALHGWVKFKGGIINEINSDFRPAGVEIVKGETRENGMIFVALGNWTDAEYGVDLTESGTTTHYGDATTPIAIYTKDLNSFFNPNSKAVIGYGEKVMVDDINEWTEFTIPIDYRGDTNVIPTHIVVTCSASRWGDYFIGCSSSVLCVDDFELIYD